MRPLRAPFVVTAAVVAASVGCDTSAPPTSARPDALTIDDGVFSFDAVSDDGPTVDATIDAADTVDATINPPECPATDPGIGAIHKPCTAATSVRCSYEDLCPQHPADQTQNVYACHDDGTGDHWTLVSKDYVPSCPTDLPKTGDPCPCTIHMGFVACNYGLCEDLSRTYAACKGLDTFDTTWSVTPITCNPPEPDGGFGDATDGG